MSAAMTSARQRLGTRRATIVLHPGGLHRLDLQLKHLSISLPREQVAAMAEAMLCCPPPHIATLLRAFAPQLLADEVPLLIEAIRAFDEQMEFEADRQTPVPREVGVPVRDGGWA